MGYISRGFGELKVYAGQVIYSENQSPVDYIYIVKNGQFECSKLYPRFQEV